jgi:cellulose synthase/poly-beta-1,6-N-acetylglucosamine synthase-like glycosyltransferase
MIVLQVIFWFSLLLIIHTYLLFPAILQFLARKKEAEGAPVPAASYPLVSVLIAAYNEKQVISSKIESIIRGEYPLEGLEILVGSDASTDGTNEELLTLAAAHPNIQGLFFEERTGKPGVINQLVEKARGDILMITDANVMLDTRTILEVVSRFRDPDVGLVDTMMINTHLHKDGISRQERFYISREVRIKHHESLIWGSMMGPFGGCYAVRKELYKPVPGNFLVDDFYINMSVLRQGFKCISNLDAKVYEDVSNNLWEEFRRKKRISAGNFQNLAVFGHMIFSGPPGVRFCFFSHKVIRWLVPFLVILTLGSSLFLGKFWILYRILAILHGAVLAVPLLDLLLRIFKIHALPLRFISHFVLMNLALLAGFIRYLGGIKSNVWQPTRRNQVHTEHH